jgi:hypothetical protein
VCKNFFERDRYSKLDWKSCFYAKSISADAPINFRFNVDAHISILAKRFYSLWAMSGRPIHPLLVEMRRLRSRVMDRKKRFAITL